MTTSKFLSIINTNNNNNLIGFGIKIFMLIDILATVLIGLLSFLTPNIQVIVFKREPTIVILIIILIIVIKAFITLCIIYSVFTFISWYI